MMQVGAKVIQLIAFPFTGFHLHCNLSVSAWNGHIPKGRQKQSDGNQQQKIICIF